MKYIRWALVAGYVYFILTQTIIDRVAFVEPIYKGLFWEAQNGMWRDIGLNILLFMPLGFLVGGWKGITIGFFLSCYIEAIQYFGRLGFCELDDILNNTIGASIGSFLHYIVDTAVVKRTKRKDVKDI